MATIRAEYGQRARHVHTVSATSMCSYDVWNIGMEHVRTRFHGGAIFHILVTTRHSLIPSRSPKQPPAIGHCARSMSAGECGECGERQATRKRDPAAIFGGNDARRRPRAPPLPLRQRKIKRKSAATGSGRVISAKISKKQDRQRRR
jgi:hypothetical protein